MEPHPPGAWVELPAHKTNEQSKSSIGGSSSRGGSGGGGLVDLRQRDEERKPNHGPTSDGNREVTRLLQTI